MGSRRKHQKRNLFGLFLNAFALKYCQEVRMGRGSECQSEIKTAHREMREGGRERERDQDRARSRRERQREKRKAEEARESER